ncbi:MAG TPA: DUF4416 family protein [Myxococcota bacterium]|nr:DUF4416 family protein [Myxococcota bacterium]HRY97364.1 DUF4416 family protein [Myxococcota bacterium]
MGEPRPPEPALLVVGCLYREEEWLQAAAARLSAALGPVEPVGPAWDFVWSDYYAREMGAGLKRRFLRAQRLAPRELLPELKLLCNRAERALADEAGRRRVNLDPGLLCSAQLVLATTKARPHRIYLRDGIWAEVALQVAGGAWAPAPWTYPDYREPAVCALLAALRLEYKEALRAARAGADTRRLTAGDLTSE